MALDPSLFSAPTNPMMPGLFLPHVRSIGGIPAHVTIEETEHDEVTITQHPVEQGAPIADHAFKQPEDVTIRAGWNLQDGDLSAEAGVYGLFLQLQAAFVPFDLMTGKRIHHNMLISSLISVTDNTSEYALMLTITCRQIILTSTQSTSVTSVGTVANQAANGPTADAGAQPLNEPTLPTAAELAIAEDAGPMGPTAAELANQESP